MTTQTTNSRLQSWQHKLSKLDSHAEQAYRSFRLSMGFVAVFFPPLLWSGGAVFYGFDRGVSMSAYYNSPMRDWFVGALFFIGLTLIAYKGYNLLENLLLDLAGVLALGVAVIPADGNCCVNCARWTAHGALSLAFFVVIMAVIWACSRVTLPELSNLSVRKKFKSLYVILALLIVASGTLALIVAFSHKPSEGNCKPDLFPWEATMVITFGCYWLIKTREIALSGIDNVAKRERKVE